MTNESLIRREIATIENTSDRPLRKARRMLRLAKRVAQGAAKMAHLSDWFIHVGDLAKAAKFQRAMHRLVSLHDEIRCRALSVIKCQDARSQTVWREGSDSNLIGAS